MSFKTIAFKALIRVIIIQINVSEPVTHTQVYHLLFEYKGKGFKLKPS